MGEVLFYFMKHLPHREGKGKLLMKKWLAACIMASVAGFWGVTASAETPVYTLNPITVTAQRVEKEDINVPVTETIVTAQKIKDTGYKNVFDAIQSQVGVSSTGYGDAGKDFGFSSGRTVIRGFDRGTLVMLDGIPMNLKNYNSLAGIPIDAVDRVEVIKGAAGTLYGAEAMGGVVNIITKKPEAGKPTVTLKGTVGNYYNDYGVTYADSRVRVSLTRELDDNVNRSNAYPHWSGYDWKIGKGQSNKAAITAKLTDEVSADFFYQNGEDTRWAENKKTKNNYQHKDIRMVTGLFYQGKDNGIKATLGYNLRKVYGNDYGKKHQIESSAKLDSWIGDIQKKWDFDADSLIFGYSFKRENYLGYYKGIDGHRFSNSFYLSYDHAFSDKFSATLGFREEFIDDAVKDQSVFTPQFQTLYKFNDSTSWYVNIGKAFQMPTVDDELKYKSGRGLKPEKGWTYETGVKKLIGDNSSLKLAVYHMDFDNKLGWAYRIPGDSTTAYAYNKGKFRNTGVEAEYTHQAGNHWEYSLGFGISNPETKDPSKKNSKWTQDSARLDGVATLTYKADKLRSTLSYKYLGDREDYSKYGQVPCISRFTWNTIYDVTKNDTLTLTLNNLFDHENFANKYGNLELPYNWRLSWAHKF